MTKKQWNQNDNNENKSAKNQDAYRNDSKLTDRNGYMIYELNNTFEDKDKDVYKKITDSQTNNNNFSNKNINNKLDNKKNENGDK